MKWTQAMNKKITKNARKIRIAGYYLHKYCKDFTNHNYFYFSAFCQSKATRKLARQLKRNYFNPNTFEEDQLDFFRDIIDADHIHYGKHTFSFESEV